MKKAKIGLLVLAVSAVLLLTAQTNSNNRFQFPKIFAGVPSGACGNQSTAVNTLNGNFYTCLSAAWHLAGAGGSGSGNVSAGGTLTNNAVVIGQGTTAVATISASTTATQALFATAGAPAFRAVAAGDLPATLTAGTAIANASLTAPVNVGQAAIITTPSAIANTETVVVQTGAALAVNRLAAGTVIQVVLEGTYIAAGAAAPVWKIHIGTAGTTSDATAFSVTGPSTVIGSSIPFRVTLDMTVRTTGSGTSGTCVGQYSHINQGVTGLAASSASTIAATVAGFDTTTADFLTVTFISGNASNNATFTQAYITFLNL